MILCGFRFFFVFGCHTRRTVSACAENLNHSTPYTAIRSCTKNSGFLLRGAKRCTVFQEVHNCTSPHPLVFSRFYQKEVLICTTSGKIRGCILLISTLPIAIIVFLKKGGMMKRTSIRIPDDDYKKIQAQAEKKSLLLADYLRYLIQLGLKSKKPQKKITANAHPS